MPNRMHTFHRGLRALAAAGLLLPLSWALAGPASAQQVGPGRIGSPCPCDTASGYVCYGAQGTCWHPSCDADGDGTAKPLCGGTDCDDRDAKRFPGNTEVCDADDRDEDCDPTTFGRRDSDGDGFVDADCANWGPISGTQLPLRTAPTAIAWCAPPGAASAPAAPATESLASAAPAAADR